MSDRHTRARITTAMITTTIIATSGASAPSRYLHHRPVSARGKVSHRNGALDPSSIGGQCIDGPILVPVALNQLNKWAPPSAVGVGTTGAIQYVTANFRDVNYYLADVEAHAVRRYHPGKRVIIP